MITSMDNSNTNTDRKGKKVVKGAATAAKRPNSSSRPKKPPGMPRRPLSAYNLFFRDCKKLLVEQRVRDGQDGRELFRTMAKTIASRWKQISDDDRARYTREAEEDANRYKREMELFYRKKVAVSEEGTEGAGGRANMPSIAPTQRDVGSTHGVNRASSQGVTQGSLRQQLLESEVLREQAFREAVLRQQSAVQPPMLDQSARILLQLQQQQQYPTFSSQLGFEDIMGLQRQLEQQRLLQHLQAAREDMLRQQIMLAQQIRQDGSAIDSLLGSPGPMPPQGLSSLELQILLQRQQQRQQNQQQDTRSGADDLPESSE